jgi:DNA repair protein RecO (recombination protein O)
MTSNAVFLQPAFILQQRKYRETSFIIDALTRDFGRVSLLAKGVRKTKSQTAGLLQPFRPLNLSYFGKSELKTLSNVEMIKPYDQLQGLALYCGFYVNELITCFLHKYDPHPEVFELYETCLSCLFEPSKIEMSLRIFELDLMAIVGYGLQLDYDCFNNKAVHSLANYHYNEEQGPIESQEGLYSGKTLLALKSRALNDSQTLHEAKILMRAVISVYLQGKPLKSRTVINQIMHHL